jgi:hypothetical protein
MSNIEQPNTIRNVICATRDSPISALSPARYIFAAASVMLGAISTFVWAVFLGWCVVDAVHYF